MGVHDSIEQLKERQTALEIAVNSSEQYFREKKRVVADLEQELRKEKSNANWAYKRWRENREELARIRRSIKTHPSDVRKYVKEHPLHFLDKGVQS